MSQTFTALVREALFRVANECPEAYRAMRSALGELNLNAYVDDEGLSVQLSRVGAEVGAPLSEASVTLWAKASDLHRLLIGELDPLAGLLDERISLQGSVNAVLALADSTTYFLKGALRAPSSKSLLERFERSIYSRKEAP